MNNPFINLRKFVRDRADPKENHATESLAACLQFSPVLRKEFVRFLFGDTPLQFNNDDCTALEVSSQENVGKFGILDLYLSLPERIHIIVEVKVEAPEDEEQLRDYSNWLKTQGGDHKFLFSLVGFPNRKFRYSEFGVLHRRTWRDLYSSFQRFAVQTNPTEHEQFGVRAHYRQSPV